MHPGFTMQDVLIRLLGGEEQPEFKFLRFKGQPVEFSEQPVPGWRFFKEAVEAERKRNALEEQRRLLQEARRQFVDPYMEAMQRAGRVNSRGQYNPSTNTYEDQFGNKVTADGRQNLQRATESFWRAKK
jgi:hypothetical protein